MTHDRQMKVYKIWKDTNGCQEVRSEKTQDKIPLSRQLMSGNPLSDWDPPVCYIHDLRVKAANFYNFGSSLLFDEYTKENLQDILEKAGQVLPLEVEGAGTLYLLHVLENIDAYDKVKSDELNAREQTKPGFKKLVFDPAKFTESSIFKLSHFPFSAVFTYQGRLASHDEFMGRYTELGLSGLHFLHEWTDE